MSTFRTYHLFNSNSRIEREITISKKCFFGVHFFMNLTVEEEKIFGFRQNGRKKTFFFFGSHQSSKRLNQQNTEYQSFEKCNRFFSFIFFESCEGKDKHPVSAVKFLKKICF
jgi:hypothetical protein